MADYGGATGPEELIPPVTQETLANLIGTTRSRVSFFMNRFKRLGYREVRSFYLDTGKDGLPLAQPFLCWDGARVMRSFRCLVWREALSGERV